MKNYQIPDKKRNRAIINLRDESKWTFTRIAKKYGLTRQRVTQIWEKWHKDNKEN